jgi:glycosyltransferase involved in cell wall biosynthesis
VPPRRTSSSRSSVPVTRDSIAATRARDPLPLPVTAVTATIDEHVNLCVLLPWLRRIVQEIVVVDDGSTDRSRELAREHGAIVVARPRRLGIGSAIYAGVARASLPIIATMDADVSHPPTALIDAYATLAAGYDVVRFSRFLPGSSWDAPLLRRVGLRVFGKLLATACRLPLTDPTNGFMLVRRACFDGPTRFTTDAGEGWVAEFLARNRGRPTAEIAYAHAARYSGRSRGGPLRELSRAIRSFGLGMGSGEPPRRRPRSSV